MNSSKLFLAIFEKLQTVKLDYNLKITLFFKIILKFQLFCIRNGKFYDLTETEFHLHRYIGF